MPTPRGVSGDEIFDALAGIVKEITAGGSRFRVCGVGCGGPMSSNGKTVSPLNIPAWRDYPLHSRLVELTGSEVAIDNDAKALALGEGWVGRARGSRDFMAMVVSTGIGGGIVTDGRLLDGRLGNAGHVGHVVVEPHGRECHCGGRGCLEAEASGTAIREMTGKDPKQADDLTVQRCGRMVGIAVASVSALLDLHLTVVAGSVALGFGDRFFDAASESLDRHARISFARGSRIERAGLGSSGPLIGAGAVGWRSVGHDVGVTR